MIRAEGLVVTRGRTAVLHGLTVDVPAGSITGLMGPSGCGKTTLMRAVVGAQAIAAGTLTVDGGPVGDARLRREIGYTSSEMGFDASSCGVSVSIGQQSPEIADGVGVSLEVREGGAGRRVRRVVPRVVVSGGHRAGGPSPGAAGTALICGSGTASRTRRTTTSAPTSSARAS